MAVRRGNPSATGTPASAPRSRCRRLRYFRGCLRWAMWCFASAHGGEGRARGQGHDRLVDAVTGLLERPVKLLQGALVRGSRDAPGRVAVQVLHQAVGHPGIPAQKLAQLDRIREDLAVEVTAG